MVISGVDIRMVVEVLMVMLTRVCQDIPRGHIYLLHVDDIIAVLGKIGANFTSILSLRSVHIVGLKNLRKTCNVETQSSKPAAGGRRVSRRREEDAESEKRSHRVNLPFLLLAEIIWDISRFDYPFIDGTHAHIVLVDLFTSGEEG